MITVREAVDADVDQIRDVFLAAYGTDYAYPQYYDVGMLKKLVYADDTLLLVAEDSEAGRILGTASVVMHIGAYNDLIGEFGRLVVHPDARGGGVGGLLMQERLKRVESQIHVGIVENRTVHPFSQRISARFGFASVGFIPMKLRLKTRESIAMYVKYFGPALELRRNNPRVIPEACTLAEMALEHCGLPRDAIVDEDSPPYPMFDHFQLEELTTPGYASLLRFERGRIKHREVFGPLRLHYGLFKLRARHSYYLLARDGDQIAGAVGFIVDDLERTVRIFELISRGEEPIRFLLDQMIHHLPEEPNAEFLEIDVSAYAPRMQRTLLELGFVPVAYIPAMVFHQVERLDAIKMVKLFVPLDLSGTALFETTKPIADLVRQKLITREIVPRLAQAIPGLAIFQGLSEEQVRRLACECRYRKYAQGEVLFAEASEDHTFYLILSGDVTITKQAADQPIAVVRPGESLGEMSFVSSATHSATASATEAVEVGLLPHDRLREVIRRRPDIGVVVYRNLAAELSEKLRRATHPQ